MYESKVHMYMVYISTKALPFVPTKHLTEFAVAVVVAAVTVTDLLAHNACT